MGYTHYYKRPQRLESRRFAALVKDTQIILESVKDYGVLLAGADGEGSPIADAKQIAFNGLIKCGHEVNPNIVIPWPSDGAGGVAQHGEDAISGEWFAGAQISTRVCNGDCSYESFIIERILKPERWQQPDENGFLWNFCKTAYRPYDLAVTAVLVAAKHHFGELFHVSSDGDDDLWWDAKLLCFGRLGYGPEYRMTDKGLIRAYFHLSDALADASREERRRLEDHIKDD